MRRLVLIQPPCTFITSPAPCQRAGLPSVRTPVVFRVAGLSREWRGRFLESMLSGGLAPLSDAPRLAWARGGVYHGAATFLGPRPGPRHLGFPLGRRA